LLRIRGFDQFWQQNLPSAISNDTVALQGSSIAEQTGVFAEASCYILFHVVHDFFSPQPVTDASVFLCRMILHDYGRSKATEILRHLRKAATQDTKLLLVEAVGSNIDVQKS
jgi:hypothetical protein